MGGPGIFSQMSDIRVERNVTLVRNIHNPCAFKHMYSVDSWGAQVNSALEMFCDTLLESVSDRQFSEDV